MAAGLPLRSRSTTPWRIVDLCRWVVERWGVPGCNLDASGGKWTVPVGAVSAAFHLGGQAMKLDFNAFYNAIRPKAGNDTWLLQVKLTFQFPD